MSHPGNDALLEFFGQRAEQAVVENDADALAQVYLDMEESGFTEQAQTLRDKFGVLSE